MVEQILADFSRAHPEFRLTCLRYFNPVGAHSSGRIGEDPNGIPNNLGFPIFLRSRLASLKPCRCLAMTTQPRMALGYVIIFT